MGLIVQALKLDRPADARVGKKPLIFARTLRGGLYTASAEFIVGPLLLVTGGGSSRSNYRWRGDGGFPTKQLGLRLASYAGNLRLDWSPMKARRAFIPHALFSPPHDPARMSAESFQQPRHHSQSRSLR